MEEETDAEERLGVLGKSRGVGDEDLATNVQPDLAFFEGRGKLSLH